MLDMEDPAITKVDVYPDYSRGFTFTWSVNPDLEEPGPWEFLVQSGQSETGGWRDISPVLSGVSAWSSNGGIRVGKGYALFFRVLMRTGSGVHVSHVVTPYGDLGRQEFLIGRDVMRREMLHCRKLAGVEVDLYRQGSWGPWCPCRDPVTGQVRDSHCPNCLGTGRLPPYHGPFRTWCLFSEDSRHSLEHAQGGMGMSEQRAFSARMVASVPLAKNDVVHDVRSGKRYYVDRPSIVAEIRRVPLVQSCVVNEVAVTDPVYGFVARRSASYGR